MNKKGLTRFFDNVHKTLETASNYTERHPEPERGLLPGCEPTQSVLERLTTLGFK